MLIAAVPTAVFAQQAKQPIDEVVVSASRTDLSLNDLPYAADVISGDDVQVAQPLLGLDESLLGVPGLLLQNRYNFAQDLRISMRGFGARAAFGIRGIRIIVDGIPETLADGQGGVDGIDLGSVARVEVLRGGVSALYGNAGGGVILIESELGRDAPELSLSAASGADGYQRWQAKLAGTAADWRYLLNVNQQRVDGYRDQNAARNRQVTARLARRDRFDGEWLISAHHTDQPQADDPGGVNREQFNNAPTTARDRNVSFDAGEALRQTRLGVRYRQDLENGGQWQARAYGLQRDFAALLPFANGGAIDLQRDYWGAGAVLRQPLVWGERTMQWAVGVDVDRQRDDRQRFVNAAGLRGTLTLDQAERVDSTGVFGEWRVDMTPTMRVTLGLRHDRLRYQVTDRFLTDGDDGGVITIRQTSPALAATWQPSDDVTVYANIARSFESPTTTELANPVGGGFNSALDPALALHRELGIRWGQVNRQRWSFAAFVIDLEDELIPFELPDAPGRDFFENAGSSDRQGLEFSWQRWWGDGMQTRISHTWSDFRFDRFVQRDGADFSGNRTPGTARHVSYAQWRYDAPADWFVVAEANRVGAITADNANSAESDRYTIVNLRAGLNRTFGRWRIAPFVSMTNAMNVAYAANTRINAFGGRYFESGPDRGVYIGVTATYRPN